MYGDEAIEPSQKFISDNNNGSRIILTTRIPEVAKRASNLFPPYHLRVLDAEASWNLLHEMVFGKNAVLPELKKIGKMISMWCRGLPLSVVLIGGLLYKSERTVYY
ncbi:Disease resistance protein RPP13 [Abeliophyllum distichum]|uniref:Disease resistance protein RPP13 n=1 Tax=Abeliophyllum distichum TaxID=126358 RepID=A0ABD1RZL2_9LAMI